MDDTTKTGETQTLDSTTVGQVDVNIDEIFGMPGAESVMLPESGKEEEKADEVKKVEVEKVKEEKVEEEGKVEKADEEEVEEDKIYYILKNIFNYIIG